MIFQDRQGSNLNRKKIKIISQAGNEIIADIERADSPTIEGTKLNATVMNEFQKEIDNSNTNASNAMNIANSASNNASSAVSTASDAETKSTTALSKAETAITTANQAKSKADYIERQLADRGTTIKVNGVSQVEIDFSSNPQTQINTKLNATDQAVDSAKLGGKTEEQLSVYYAQSSGNANTCTNSVNLTGDQTISGTKTFSDTVNASTLKFAGNNAEAIVSSSLGANGYMKYKSGLIIQWGSIVTPLTNANKTTLPIAFSNKNYIVCANTSGITSQINLYAIACTPVSTTQFYALANYNSQSINAKYIAIGY